MVSEVLVLYPHSGGACFQYLACVYSDIYTSSPAKRHQTAPQQRTSPALPLMHGSSAACAVVALLLLRIKATKLRAQSAQQQDSFLPFSAAGGVIALLLLRPHQFRNHPMSAALIGVTLGLGFFIGATPFIDNSGNVAGLVSGFLLTVSFLMIKHKVRLIGTACWDAAPWQLASCAHAWGR